MPEVKSNHAWRLECEALREALRTIATLEACSNSEPDAIGDALDTATATARAALDDAPRSRDALALDDMLEALRDIATCENADYMRDIARSLLARFEQ